MLANILVWNGIVIFIISSILGCYWSLEKEDDYSYKSTEMLTIKIIVSAIVFFISLNMIIIGANLK